MFFRLKDKIERNNILLQKTEIHFKMIYTCSTYVFFLLTLVVPHMSESGLTGFFKFQQKLCNV